MRPPFILAAALAATAMPAMAAGSDTAIIRIAAAPPRAGWFVCDGIDGAFAAFFGARDAKGRSVVTLMDRNVGRLTTSSVDVAAGDAGAGQIFYALGRGGRPVGLVHMVNPGMVGDPVLPAVTGVDLDGHHLECRFMPDMRFLGIALKRSIMVRGQGAGVVYESFDMRSRGATTHPDGVHRSNVPSLAIRNGTGTSDGGFRFVNGRVRYTVSPGPEAGAVQAVQAGRTLATDRFVGSAYAPLRAIAAIGRDAIWAAGADFRGCRDARGDDALRACLIEAMQAGGATPAAVSFTGLLADRGDFGFMTGWRQAGPVGIATITYPFRANSNEAQAIMPPASDPIFIDGWQPGPADRARPDYRAFVAAHRDAFPITPAEASAAKTAPGRLVTIRARYALATCRACAVLGTITVAYRFDAAGHPIGSGVEAVR